MFVIHDGKQCKALKSAYEKFTKGQVITALNGLREHQKNLAIDNSNGVLRRMLAKNNIDTRNDLMHFNPLYKPYYQTTDSHPNKPDKVPVLALSDMINNVRNLLGYDRKLKNAVAKSIKELLARRGIIISWQQCSPHGALHNAFVKAQNIEHLKGKLNLEKRSKQKKIFENVHSKDYVKMVGKVF